MGMDGVEIVMAVEEAFDLRIDDAEAAKILTPRQLIELVQSKVAITDASVCLTLRAFNLLRKSLLRHGNWKRSEITPATNLSGLIKRNRRKELLLVVTTELGIKQPPKLILPNWLNLIVLVGSLLVGVFAAVVTRHFFDSVAILIFLLAAIFAAGVALRLTQPFRKNFPSNLQTIGDLARWVMTHKADLATASFPAWTREQIATRVREIIVSVLGCKSDFSEEANFVKDLGLN
jgi:acyl carrier protein